MAEESQATQAARKQLEEERKVREKSAAEYAARSQGKPTPTQEELDLANLGANFTEHESDGGQPDPFGGPIDEKKLLELSRAEYAKRMRGKPTPTQEELNKLNLGEAVPEKEDDGSGPEELPAVWASPAQQAKAMQAENPSASK